MLCVELVLLNTLVINLNFWVLEPHRIPVSDNNAYEESSVALATIKGDRSTIITDEIEELKELLEEESNSKCKAFI